MLRSLTVLIISVFSVCAMAHSGQVAERIQRSLASGLRPEPVELFKAVGAADLEAHRWNKALAQATVVQLDLVAVQRLLGGTARSISVALPFEGHTLMLDLERAEISPGGLPVTTSSGRRVDAIRAAHFRGMVRGVPGSLVALSVFEEEVMAMVDDGTGAIVVGRFLDRKDTRHVVYRDRDLRKAQPFVCATADATEPYRPEQLRPTGEDRSVRCVRYYWEVNYNVFQGKGSVAATATYATGLFNQSATLFANDGIDVVLSELFIWDTPSPYTGPSSGNFLTQFGNYRTSFNGDLAHLIGYGGGGGVAWLNTICSSATNLRMAYSGINSGYSNVPTYSWSVNVVTHEAGHNLGSNHTHACVWNGNGTSIDGCGPAAGYTEGSCATGPLPTGTGGTIMSYCHLVSGVGINFSRGFGPQPTVVIHNAVNGATCLVACGTSCEAPHNLNAVSVTTTEATLTWANIGATAYVVRWRMVGASEWTSVAGIVGNTQHITGLTQGTPYEFQVSATCSSGTSPFSASFVFTTPLPCPDVLEPNNTLATSAVIPHPTTLSALIASPGDVDHYQFSTTGMRSLFVNLSGLYANYDLRLLNSAGATIAASTNTGTTAEYLSYMNAPPGTYHVQVVGVSGAFNADMCYTLSVSSYASECIGPRTLTVSAITHESATVSWEGPSAGGQTLYDLRWKPHTTTTWTDVSGLSTTTYQLHGLLPLTFYDVQVRKSCGGSLQGGVVSAYSDTATFSTSAIPCEVAPPIQLRPRLFLDGPYDPLTGLMHDSLRVRGLIPLHEPYTALGHVVEGAGTTTATVLAATGPNAVVDWVLVELRAATAPYDVLASRAALLQRDGDVVWTDGESPVYFCSPGGEPYRIGIKHRNHLGCVSGQNIFLGAVPVTLDLAGGFPTYGSQAQRVRSGVSLLWAGNAQRDAFVLYTGQSNDRDAVLSIIGGVVPTNTVAGYLIQDVNMDGVAKYTGVANDRDAILGTIGGVVPTNSVQEQAP